MGGAEVAFVVFDDHIFAVSFQHAAVGPGLAEDFTDNAEIQSEGIGEAKAFGETGGIDVHHHIQQRLELGGAAGGADVFVGDGQGAQHGLGAVEGFLGTGAH